MCAITAQTQLKYDATHKKSSIAKVLAEQTVKPGTLFESNYNIWIGMQAFVITADAPKYLQPMQFGFQLPWSSKSMLLFNARAEGKENLEQEEPAHAGIFEMPAFKEPIRQRRCIVPVDYFIEGPEQQKLNQPFLIQTKEQEAILLAGIWETWRDEQNGQVKEGFAIVTTAAAPLLKEIGHHRSPLRLRDEEVDLWLREKSTEKELSKLLQTADFSDCEAIAIDPIIKSKKNSKDIIRKRLSLFD